MGMAGQRAVARAQDVDHYGPLNFFLGSG
jgi:hypothetical protein